MNVPPPLPRIDPGQLSLLPEDPVVGERWRNRNTGTIVAVESIAQRRYGWVTIRSMGERQTIRHDNFVRFFARI